MNRPFNVPFYLQTYEKKKVNGVNVESFTPLPDEIPTDDKNIFFGSFQTYGGTETVINDVFVVLDTAKVRTWYRPDIKKGCRIVRLTDMAVFRIINQPENYLERGQDLIFKVERIVP
jgi:hypothetical protein